MEGDPDIAAAEILGYSMEMAADRKANPRDDIVTKLVHADVDGHNLNDDEFGYFVIILTVAGNETTRNAITHGMNAFLDNPDQWELWKRERPETMVDEVIRWATPVSSFQRTALNDVEVGGVQVKKGQRVGLFYASANFDDDVFERPVHLRHHPRPQPARRLRRPRRALLHRRQPGPPGGQADVQRAGRPGPGHREGGASRAGCGRRGSTGSRTSRSSTPEPQSQSRAVSTTGPPPVIATVCSMCAPREPSALRSVQPSGSV